MTTNHNYNTPAEGTEDWNLLLNENFDILDRDVEVRDAEDARGNYEPQDGAKFLSTDTGAVYIGDGSSWNFLGEVVPEQTGDGGGGTPHSADWVVGSDTEMQTAVNDASNGDFIYVTGDIDAAGTYRFDNVQDLTIMGRHYRGTRLRNDNDPIFHFNGCHRLRLARFYVSGGHSNQNPLIHCTNGNDPVHYNNYYHDLRIGESPGGGIFWDGNFHDSSILRCEFYALGDDSLDGYNLKISDSGSGCRGNQIVDCRFERNSPHGTEGGHLYFSGLRNSAIRGCKFHGDDATAARGLAVSGGGNHRTHFIGDYFFDIYRSDQLNWDDSDKGLISSCVFYGDADTGVLAGSNKTVSNCLFDGGMNRGIDAANDSIIVGNRVTQAEEGVRTTGSGNLVAVNHSTNYNLSSGTTAGLNV